MGRKPLVVACALIAAWALSSCTPYPPAMTATPMLNGTALPTFTPGPSPTTRPTITPAGTPAPATETAAAETTPPVAPPGPGGGATPFRGE